MKYIATFVVAVCFFSSTASAQTRIYQKGTVTRMRMGGCMSSSNNWIAILAGQPGQLPAADTCPEYTLISDRVVYVMVAKSNNDLIPLAEDIDFRFSRNEILVRVDDSPKEVHLAVRAMTLRDEWDRDETERQRNRASTRVVHGESLR